MNKMAQKDPELDDFLSKVDLLNKTVKDICENKATEAQITKAQKTLGIHKPNKSNH
jgi:hypothetical protein